MTVPSKASTVYTAVFTNNSRTTLSGSAQLRPGWKRAHSQANCATLARGRPKSARKCMHGCRPSDSWRCSRRRRIRRACLSTHSCRRHPRASRRATPFSCQAQLPLRPLCKRPRLVGQRPWWSQPCSVVAHRRRSLCRQQPRCTHTLPAKPATCERPASNKSNVPCDSAHAAHCYDHTSRTPAIATPLRGNATATLASYEQTHVDVESDANTPTINLGAKKGDEQPSSSIDATTQYARRRCAKTAC